MKSKIITGLDIGTYTMKALAAQKKGSEWEVLSYGEIPSFGLRRGSVVNIEEATRNIQLLFSKIEKDINRPIDSAFVNIGGSHLHVEPSDGLISVSRADKIISQEDIDRVLEATKSINISSNESVLDVFVKEFVIDDHRGIKQPLDLVGVRLQAKVILLCYFQSYFMNLTQAVLGSGIQIDDVVPSPLAAARAVLTPQQKEIGVALIDIGAATTSLAVFEEGTLVHLAVFPLGSGNITNDIAIGLRTQVPLAEEIKKKHGLALFEKGAKDSGKMFSFKEMGEEDDLSDDKKIKKESGDSHHLSFSKKTLVSIIEPRVAEIIGLMQKELKSAGVAELLPGGIVLTGGGAKLPRIKELVKDQLKLPCQIGVPTGILGLGEDPSLATVAGLVLGGADFEGSDSKGPMEFKFLKNMSSHLRKMFRVFIP